MLLVKLVLLEIQFEEIDPLSTPVKVDKTDVLFEHMKKTFVYQYSTYSRKRKSLFLTLRLFFELLTDDEGFDTSTPCYLLDYLLCSELNLKNHLLQAGPDCSNQFAIHCKQLEYIQSNQMKILNLDDFEDILQDFDRYVKDAKKRANSSMHVFMKNNRLSSLVYSKPVEETAFRFMDIRLRVFLYKAMRKHTMNSLLVDKFYLFLNKAGLGQGCSQDLDQVCKSMQTSISLTQRSLVLSVHDLLLKHEWTEKGLINKSQQGFLTEWLVATEGTRVERELPKTYNTALYNRLLDLKLALSDFFINSNSTLTELKRIASPNCFNTSTILPLASSFDPKIKAILYRKTMAIMDRWKVNFLKQEISPVDSGQPVSKMLLSLKLTIKLCQMINILQNSFKLRDKTADAENMEYKIQDVHLLSPLSPFKDKSSKPEKDGKSYLRYFMSKILLTHILKSAKCREMQEVLQKFRDSVKKDQDAVFKNNEFDHLVAQNVNFCNMAVMLSSQRKRRSTHNDAPELSIDQVTVSQYLDNTVESSFLFPNYGLLETNLASVLVELAKSIMEAQILVYQRASLEIAIRRPKKKVLVEPNRKDNLAENIMANNETQLLPFLVNFLASFIGKSYSIVTNNEEECYIIGREDFLDIMVVLLRESGAYTQEVTRAFRNHYLTSYIHSMYAKVVSSSSLKFLKKHFLYLLKDFHKLVEGQLAQQNFNVVYELDRLSKSARYSVYDGGLVLDKLKSSVASKYEPRMNAVELEGQDIAVRAQAFKENHLPLKILEYGAKLHNQNMANLKENAAKVLEDSVHLVDAKTGLPLNTEEVRGRLSLILDDTADAQIGKVHAALEKLKQGYREKVILQLNKLEAENKRLEEQINKEDNTRKKIRELTVRESLLKEELAATKGEMDALTQQNGVLERDIHTCNFERINLTRQLQDTKEKLDKLQLEVNKQIAERTNRSRKSLFPMISKDGQPKSTNLKPGTAQLSKVKSYQGLVSQKLDLLEESLEESDAFHSKEEHKGLESQPIKATSSKPKKKGFAFVNGRLERRFNLKK